MQAHLGVVLEHDEAGGEVLADEQEGHDGGEEGVGRALWARSAGPPLLHRSSQWTRGGRASTRGGRLATPPLLLPSQGC